MTNLLQFLEACETGTDRSTFYNSATQQTESIDTLHKEVLDFDRELYCLIPALDSLNDYNRLLITRNLLFQTGYVTDRDGKRTYVRYGKADALVVKHGSKGLEQDWTALENRIIVNVVWKNIPIPRLLREWAKWRNSRLNNARSKRLVLQFVLGNPSFSHWVLRYRPNLRRALSHAWGDARTRRMRKAAAAFLDDHSENRYVREQQKWMFRYVRDEDQIRRAVCENICFLFGDLRQDFRNPQFAQYVEALENPEKMLGLPLDIAIGLRNRRHKDFPKKRLLEAGQTQRQMSAKQRVRLQRTAEREGVELDKDLKSLSLVDILKYGYEMGFGDEVRTAITERADADAQKCRLRLGHVAVVIDTSKSMYGRDDRKLHPIAAALSIGILSKRIAHRCDLFYTGGGNQAFPLPAGDTDLASAVLLACKSEPELVMIVTDGYENVTAGTLNDVVRALRKVGNNVPMVQLSPVLAAEAGQSGGIRRVADSVYAGAVKGAESIGTMYEKLLLIGATQKGEYMALKKFLVNRLPVKEVPDAIEGELRNAKDLESQSIKLLDTPLPTVTD